MKKIVAIFLLIGCVFQFNAQLLQPRGMHVYATNGKSKSIQLNGVVGQVVTGTSNSSNYLITQGMIQTKADQKQYLPQRYNIGEIPNQTVYSSVEKTFAYYSKALGLKAVLSYQFIDKKPLGKINFIPAIGKFSFTPDIKDIGNFPVVFKAILGKDTLSQQVIFNCVPRLKAEQITFGLSPNKPLPDEADDDYVIVNFTRNKIKEKFNYSSEPISTYALSIAGKKLLFDKNKDNKLKSFCTTPRNDIKDIYIYAETIEIACPLIFAQSNVTIVANKIIFRDGAEKALINTSPVTNPLPRANNIDGEAGNDAGNITLQVKNIEINQGIRLIARGGNGQNSNYQKAGNGGKGGEIASTSDLTSFSDTKAGIGGVSYGLNNVVNVPSCGSNGSNGAISIINKTYNWFHPNYLRMVVLHAKSAYLNGYMNATHQIFSDYLTTIDLFMKHPEWNDLTSEEQNEIDQMEKDMRSVMYRIASNLDYFGNPAGWAPMLSFEVNKLAFEKEKDNALQVLYLTYWLQKSTLKNEEKLAILSEGRTQQQQDLNLQQTIYDEVIGQIPVLESESKDVENETKEVQQGIIDLEQQLLERAKHIVEEKNKPNLWRSIGRAVGTLCKVIPIYQPALGAIGTGIEMISNINLEQPIQGILNDGASIYKQFSTIDFQTSTKNLQSTLKSIDITKANFTDPKQLDDYFKKIKGVASPIYDGIKGLKSKIGELQVPNDQVKVELERLKAESPEYKDLVNRLDLLIQRKAELAQKIDVCLQAVASSANSISQGVLTINSLNVDIYAADSRRDLKAMIYAKEMEKRAKERLIKYHYFLAKSYEFRLVKEYKEDLNLPAMFDRLKTIVEKDSVFLTKDEYTTLGAIYTDVISKITDDILTIYNSNAPSNQLSFSYRLTKEDIRQLNIKGNNITVNLVERGLFLSGEENLRIVNISIDTLTFKKPSPSGYFNLAIEHCGISKVRKNGEVFIFNHYNNQNLTRWDWESRYDFESRLLIKKTTSPSDKSLLMSVLNGLNKSTIENNLIYSQPGAWADLIFSTGRIPEDSDAEIDNVVIKITYDYNNRPSSMVNMNVYTNNDMKPYIEVGTEDKNSRKDGWGTFTRTYDKRTSGKVNLRATLNYGAWKFEKWTDLSGKLLANGLNPSIDVPISSSISVRANYVLIQPVLKVENDTVILKGFADKKTLKIENIANGDMNWYVEKFDDWVNIGPKISGINTSTLEINVEPNPTKSNRVSKFIVYAPSSIDYRDTVIVIQEAGKDFSITSIQPENACKGDTVLVKGNNFSTIDSLYIANKKVEFLILSDSTIKFIANEVVSSQIVLFSRDTVISSKINFTVNNLPSAPEIIGEDVICLSSNSTFTSNIIGGSWSLSDEKLGVINNLGLFSPKMLGKLNVNYRITDQNGCSVKSTKQITVTDKPAPVVITSINELCIGQSTSVTASYTSGTWSSSSSSVVKVFNDSLIGVSEGTATVTFTKSVKGCGIVTGSKIIKVNPLPVIIAQSDNIEICKGASVTLTAVGANSYFWDNNVTDGVPFKPTITSIFTVEGTDSKGCSNTSSVTVKVNELPKVVAIASKSLVCINDSVSLSGSGALSYIWDNSVKNGIQFKVVSSKKYTVIGTDKNGCVDTASVVVAVNALPKVVASATKTTVCAGENVILRAEGAVSYIWNNNVSNGISFQPTTTKTYTVIGTGSNGCKSSSSIIVRVNSLPVVVAKSTKLKLCFGENLTLTASGAISYLWDNSVKNGVSFVPTVSKTYTVTGVDANGCKNTAKLAIEVIALPKVLANASKTAVCTGGDVILTGSGASKYKWDNNVSNGVSFAPTSTKTYTVTGTDANGCSNTAKVNVAVNLLPSVVATASKTSICLGEKVTLTGKGALSYTWNNNVVQDVAFSPTKSTKYTVTGTNLSGCSNTSSVEITVNTLPIISAKATKLVVCKGESVSLTGLGAKSYVWDNNVVNGVSFIPTITKTYTVLGTDANGCKHNSTIKVVVNSLPLPQIFSSSTTNKACADDGLELRTNSIGTYLWSNGDTTQSIYPIKSGIYSVKYTDDNGCSANSNSIKLTIYPLPKAEITMDGNDTFCLKKLTQLISTSAVSYLWNNGETTKTIKPKLSGTYYVKVKDINGCFNTSAPLEVLVTDACVSVEKIDQFSVRTYPNPVFNELILEIHPLLIGTSFKIIDFAGKSIIEGNCSHLVNSIDLSEYPSGSYFIQISGKSFKIIKQ